MLENAFLTAFHLKKMKQSEMFQIAFILLTKKYQPVNFLKQLSAAIVSSFFNIVVTAKLHVCTQSQKKLIMFVSLSFPQHPNLCTSIICCANLHFKLLKHYMYIHRNSAVMTILLVTITAVHVVSVRSVYVFCTVQVSSLDVKCHVFLPLCFRELIIQFLVSNYSKNFMRKQLNPLQYTTFATNNRNSHNGEAYMCVDKCIYFISQLVPTL